jgi:hypothetical protein
VIFVDRQELGDCRFGSGESPSPRHGRPLADIDDTHADARAANEIFKKALIFR